MSNFSILGKTKKKKFGNILGLTVLGLYLLSKADFLNMALEMVHKEQVPISGLNLKSMSEVNSAIQKYQINMEGVAKEAQRTGVSLSEFKKSVKMDIVVPTDILETKELTLEFISNEDHSAFKPIYRYIATDMAQFFANHD